MMDADPGLTAYSDLCNRDLVKKMNELHDAGVQREMPRYKCHKEVWALKIAEIKNTTEAGSEGDGSRIIIPSDAGFAPFRVEFDYMRKHNPQVGGYYVVYSDGYKSYSPAKAFEDGYERL